MKLQSCQGSGQSPQHPGGRSITLLAEVAQDRAGQGVGEPPQPTGGRRHHPEHFLAEVALDRAGQGSRGTSSTPRGKGSSSWITSVALRKKISHFGVDVQIYCGNYSVS